MASINRIPPWPQFALMRIVLHLCFIDLALSFCNVASSKWQTFVVYLIQMRFLQSKMNHRKAGRITSSETTVPLCHQCNFDKALVFPAHNTEMNLFHVQVRLFHLLDHRSLLRHFMASIRPHWFNLSLDQCKAPHFNHPFSNNMEIALEGNYGTPRRLR